MKITNRKAYHEYTILKDFVAGIQLVGSEVKSIRNGNASLQDSYCLLLNNEIYIRGLYIAKNKMSSSNNHEEKRDRKLLLTKKEIKNIIKDSQITGTTIIALEVITGNKIKIKIGIAKGKKLWDRREDSKKKDTKREIKRDLDINI